LRLCVGVGREFGMVSNFPLGFLLFGVQGSPKKGMEVSIMSWVKSKGGGLGEVLRLLLC
jgi:hypothetical protein